MKNLSVQAALDYLDGTLIHELPITRVDGPTRTKVQIFELPALGKKQFGVHVYDADKATGKFLTPTTRVFLEKFPDQEIPDVERLDGYLSNGSRLSKQSDSRLTPDRQRAVMVGSLAGLQKLLEWYTEAELSPQKSPTKAATVETNVMTYSHATNTILYGPPGTGKTYLTATRAVELCDGHAPPHRGDLLKRYEELRREERVRFVTFHQSYGYEDFVEGLRPVLVDGKVAYRVEPGVFRKACDAAKRTQTVKPGLQGKPLRDRGVYKMSLGARRDEGGVKVFQECLEKECVLLGWGEDVDFSGCKDEGAIRERLKEVKPEIDRLDSQVQFVNIFMHELKTGDIVIVSDGNRLFRAIAEVTGDYAFLEDGTFHQMRPVKWLAVLENPPSVREVFDRDFVQRSLYKLAREGLNFTRLEELLRAVETEPVVKPYVLIIDEINRANISKVFGELITLLEPDKREGASNAITVKLPYSGDDFSVPSNLHIIATMNTADRSIALLDTALRRRFDFDEVLPNPSLLNGKHVDGVDLSALLTALNERIEALFDRDHTIGHAYLLGVDSLQKLDVAFRRKLLPLLQEYFYENWERIRNVLNDKDGAFVTAVDRTATVGDGLENSSSETRRVYAVNKVAFVASAFKRIYEG